MDTVVNYLARICMAIHIGKSNYGEDHGYNILFCFAVITHRGKVSMGKTFAVTTYQNIRG